MTNRDDISADLVVLECRARGIDLFRLNTEDYPIAIRLNVDPLDPVSAGLIVDGQALEIGGAALWVWRPKWPTIDPVIRDDLDSELAMQESVAALGGLFRLLAARSVSPPDAMQAARWKVPQLSVARACGMLVPETLVTSDPVAACRFASRGTTVLKPVAESRVSLGAEERVGFVTDIPADADWERVLLAPVVLQRRIDKRADLRVTMVGKQAFAVRIETPFGSPTDFRSADPTSCKYEVMELTASAIRSCCRFLDHFGLRFGAFDFAVDQQGALWFLECNPAGQWGWLEDATGLRITSAIVDLLLSLR